MATTPDTSGSPLVYQGLKMVRFDPAMVASPEGVLEEAYREAHRPMPALDRDLRDHDVWYCRNVRPCNYCVKTGAAAEQELAGAR